jgi:hypothetical protein
MSGTSLSTIVDRHNDWPAAVREFNGVGTEFPRNADEQHARLIRWFEEAELASQDARERSQTARRYIDGDQWTKAELDVLNARGQPAITFNYVKRKTELLCGLERKARTDPKAFPRTPAEDDRADAATQALRFIADDNDFQPLRSAVFNDMLVEGFGGLEVGLEDDGQGGANVTLTQVPWDRIWYDPHSRRDDFLDCRYNGIVIWMDRDQLEEMYPDAGDVVDASFSTTNDATQYADRPGTLVWTDSRRTRVRVVQCNWSDRGKWWTATFTRSGYLTEPKASVYKDRHGKSACPLLLQSAYTDMDNNRYGMVSDLISPQDMINKAYSKAIHQMSVHQVVAEKGAVQDVDQARREVARPDGYVEVMPGLKFEIADASNNATGQLALLQHAVQEMQLSGPNAAMSGTDTRELSGRAILAQQAGGATQNEPLADSLRMWARRVYEMCWMAAREYWTAGKWVRVTDDLNETRWVGINQPVRLMDELAAMTPEERAVEMRNIYPPLQPGDPRLQQVIRIENDITDLDVEITIQEGPDIPAMQQETFQTLVQLASLQPGLIPGDVLIAASSLRDKDALLERMKQHQQQQGQMQQQAAQLAGQHAQVDIQTKQAKAAADMALAQERKVNAARGVHDIHADFSAPPGGQPYVDTPDNAAGVHAPSPEQMTPDMALAHQMAELQKKHADIRKTQADTALTAAKIPQVGHETVGTIADTHQTLVNTNRLARTPIPQPGQGAAP